MTGTRPPRIVLVVLRALHVDDEALVGDIVEEFGTRRSHLWLWCQVLGAVLVRPERRWRTGPLGIGDARFVQSGLRPAPRRQPRTNLSGGPVPGIGGLSVVALAFHVMLVSPQILWLPVLGSAAGSLLGLALVVRRRSEPYGMSGSRCAAVLPGLR